MTEEKYSSAQSLLERGKFLQLQGFENEKYAHVNFDDERLFDRLKSRARFRSLTLADLDEVSAALWAEDKKNFESNIAFHRSCNERREDLKVFYVTNTAGNELTVLAKDAKCARLFASLCGHIREKLNGTVRVLKPEHEAQLRNSGEALGRALRDGYPGVVTKVGENVVMASNRKVYTPMTIVE